MPCMGGTNAFEEARLRLVPEDEERGRPRLAKVALGRPVRPYSRRVQVTERGRRTVGAPVSSIPPDLGG